MFASLQIRKALAGALFFLCLLAAAFAQESSETAPLLRLDDAVQLAIALHGKKVNPKGANAPLAWQVNNEMKDLGACHP